ncbi:MAG: GNAT family N-acetyltransferase [Clostridia bacterium]|nr:GNAT family N-acetyltransferase [Clostridia bacterium]
MIYRKYESKDISAVRDILENDLGYNCELDKLNSRINEMMKRGNYQIFVAYDGEKVVGFIGCVNYLAFELENEGMKIIALAVSKEYRRKGIGTQLLKTTEQWAKENNIEVILLNSGLPREDAHAFYESQDYFKKSYGFIKKI